MTRHVYLGCKVGSATVVCVLHVVLGRFLQSILIHRAVLHWTKWHVSYIKLDWEVIEGSLVGAIPFDVSNTKHSINCPLYDMNKLLVFQFSVQ